MQPANNNIDSLLATSSGKNQIIIIPSPIQQQQLFPTKKVGQNFKTSDLKKKHNM